MSSFAMVLAIAVFSYFTADGPLLAGSTFLMYSGSAVLYWFHSSIVFILGLIVSLSLRSNGNCL